ncbi:MAG: RsmE family RNA methyltransferase [Bacteroidota bacterium]
MNLILFTPEEIRAEANMPLPRTDPRAKHILRVLRRAEGDTFDVGLVNGPMGKARVDAIETDHIRLSFSWSETPPPLAPVTVLLGWPRPQTARRLLRELTTLGAGTLLFTPTEKSEPSYQSSKLWTTGEWKRHLRQGAEQAFDTRLPAVVHAASLSDALSRVAGYPTRIALDNYEAPHHLRDLARTPGPIILALGPERGWSNPERDTLRAAGFTLAHLGPRVLKLETAAAASVAWLLWRGG